MKLKWSNRTSKTSDPPVHRNERGSFIVAAALFMTLFIFIASMGIDGSRYYMKKSRLQNIADAAALTGGQSFNQFDTRPSIPKVKQAVVEYIKEQQGEAHGDLYDIHSASGSDNIVINPLNPPSTNSTCTKGFGINKGKVVTTRPSDVETEVIGIEYTDYGKIKGKANIKDSEGNDTDIYPWGPYDDSPQGDLNDSSTWSPLNMKDVDAGSTVTLSAKDPDRNNEATMGGPESRTLSNGDDVPDVAGAQDQADLGEVVAPYTTDGKIDLKQNQAIVLFETWEDDYCDNDDFGCYYELQDAVMLVTVNPKTTGGGSSSSSFYSTPTQGAQSGTCSPYPNGTYRVGVLVFDSYQPYFLPEAIFGAQNNSMMQKAVAQIQPQHILETKTLDMNCGVYADQGMTIEGNNVNKQAQPYNTTNFCSNGTIDASGSQNGVLGDLYAHEDASINIPGGNVGATEKFPKKLTNPTFNHTNSNDYDVDLGEFNYWSDQNHCNGPGDQKAMRTQGASSDYVEWANGDKVCVKYDSSDNEYLLEPNGNPGKMQMPDGSSVSVHADGNVVLGNKVGVYGGLYATGNITVNQNNHDFIGDPNKLDGLALWAEGNVTVDQNNVEIDGITGAEGDFTFATNGGGNGPDLEGKLVTHGHFSLGANSGNASLVHDTSKYNPSALNNAKKEMFTQSTSDRPLFSNIRVKLVN